MPNRGFCSGRFTHYQKQSICRWTKAPLTENRLVEKQAEKLSEEHSTLGDLSNLAFLATHVTYGRGKGIVYATGMKTEIGKIAARLAGPDKELTPLQKRLEQIGKVIAFFCIGVCLLVLALELWSGEEFTDSFMTAVALAVASIPEALATVVTVILALGVEEWQNIKPSSKNACGGNARRGFVVCSDKTGTLTENKMTVTTVVNRKGEVKKLEEPLTDEEKYLLGLFALCTDHPYQMKTAKSYGWGIRRGTCAVGCGGENRDQKYHAKSRGEPFDSNRKMMSVVLKTQSDYLIVTRLSIS